jgi:natural product biosynthesis luciferase-like monooxygenase protein
MKAKDQFSCFLFGSDTLLIECAELLHKDEQRILGVVTRAPRIANWAAGKNIPVIGLDSDYLTRLKQQPFDYLFSITHLEIIPDEILQLPTKGAINFHDGPLPRYAGINAPIWALINQEAEYGITWHAIVPGIDEGDILKQRFFPIGADETALSINTQCFAAALESFPELLHELKSNNVCGQSQNLDERSYFAKFKRPQNATIIDWEQSSRELEALVRALNFGDYANPIGSPKIFYQGHAFLVTKAKAGEASTIAGAGSIISADDSAITVATGNGVLSMQEFQTLEGRPLSAGDLAAQYQISVGCRFDNVGQVDLDRLNELNKRLCRGEDYWLQHLSSLEPIEIPYANTDGVKTGASASIEFDFHGSVDDCVGSFVILLARLSQKYRFDLSYSDDALVQQSEGLESLVNSSVVLSVSLEAFQSCRSQQLMVSGQLSKIAKRGSWLHDLVARHKELRAIAALGSDSLLPIGLAVTANLADYTHADGSKHAAGSPLTLVLSACGSSGKILYDPNRFSHAVVSKLKSQLIRMIDSIRSDPEQVVADIELLSEVERDRILVEWNQTQVDYDSENCIHMQFEKQAAENPDKTALVYEDQFLTYRQLNEKANSLAYYLRALGVGADDMVGVHVERSLDLMVATLGVMKAGAAYVPLDPAFPTDRLNYMIEDAGMRVILTQESIQQKVHVGAATIVRLDTDWPAIQACPIVNLLPIATSENLAYVIYTSGSTGKPKGVMVEHRNVINFFVGMDRCIPYDEDSSWLAVTSLSFDISVLELFWTLTRGLKVVLYRDGDKSANSSISPAIANRPMEFGLFMWGNDDAPGSSKYRLMIEGAKYFDDNKFDAVWTPERHFSAFGGPFPNPAVTSAAIASITSNIQIRSGSCVSPLHHPIRIAEDWAVVDNLSDGRVGLSFAAGWQPNDFVIMPQNHADNKSIMLDQIKTVQQLWRGEKVPFANPMGEMVDILTLPRPVQKELPVWLTTAGNPESYRQAGTMGCNVLTHLLGQSVEELTGKIAIYREARRDAGFDPHGGKVSLMLHTFVGEGVDAVRELVREPMKDYLRSSMKLVLDFAWSFPAFKRPGGDSGAPADVNLKSLSDEESETILEFAFERYFETSGLFGTPDICLAMINRCKAADVDEIACLLDFGVETDVVMSSLPLLKQVRDMANTTVAAPENRQSFHEQVTRHNITHFQCTPSHARMLIFSEEARSALASIQHMMVGGEALPASLAKELKGILGGSLTNMYGPTETTIWSTTQRIDDASDITVGRPIANTGIYLLDANKKPVPPGVAGDLYIGGEGVVRGYLNRPELTAERFVANPYGSGDDQRIYWTGDLARYRDDGIIEFLGRMDHQVKIRGYRIELGEIETLIGRYPEVTENVLLLREDSAGDQRLVAYLVATHGKIDASKLKTFLRAQLPEYMVPAEIIVLAALPLTPNGKIDRNALPSPQSMQPVAVAQYVAPEDGLEKTIAKLWQDTLKLESVGVNDNFFDLGGHSLLIVSMHSQLKELIDIKVSLTDLYGYPTIRSLTQFLSSGGAADTLKKSTDRAQRRRQMMGRRRR